MSYFLFNQFSIIHRKYHIAVYLLEMGKTAHFSERIRSESLIIVNRIIWTVQWLSGSQRKSELSRANGKKERFTSVARHASYMKGTFALKLMIHKIGFPYPYQKEEAKCASPFSCVLFLSSASCKWDGQISC